MSLLFHRRAIEHAVAGELSGREELRLRAHCMQCNRCRLYYDSLSRTARALGDESDSGAREAERLFAQLDERTVMAPRFSPRRRLVAILLPAGALAAAFVVVRLPARKEEPAVTYRGGPMATESKASLLVYASEKRPGGRAPLRLAADLPGSVEGRLSMHDEVQFAYRQSLGAAYVAVVAVRESGEITLYETGLLTTPTQKPRPFGKSIDLGTWDRAGRFRLYAIFSASPIESARLASAARDTAAALEAGGPLALPGEQVSGLFSVEP